MVVSRQILLEKEVKVLEGVINNTTLGDHYSIIKGQRGVYKIKDNDNNNILSLPKGIMMMSKDLKKSNLNDSDMSTIYNLVDRMNIH